MKSILLSILQSPDFNTNCEIISNSNFSILSIMQSAEKYKENNRNSLEINNNNSNPNKFKQPNAILVNHFEKDPSTFNKKESIGSVYVWGQNSEGQLGIFFNNNNHNSFDKKLKINYPKLISPLKDSIIIAVACGFNHTLAINNYKNVLSWGSNQYSQLGLGNNSTNYVITPTIVPILEKIWQVILY